MKPLKDIHFLIQSLDQGEKRYVKLMGRMMSGEEDSGVLILFDLLNRQKSLDVEATLALRAVKSMGKGLPTQLRRLRKLVLRAVTILQSERSIASQLQQMLQELEFLVSRNFVDEAIALANRGIGLARKYAYHEHCISFLDGKRRMLNDRPGLQAEINDTFEQIRATQQDLADLNAMRTLHSELLSLLKKPARSLLPQDRQLVATLAENPVVLKALGAPHLLHRFLSMDAVGMRMLHAREGPPALAHYTRLLHLWKEAPQWYREMPDLFLVLFRHYQMAVMFGTLEKQAVGQYLQELPDAKYFPLYHQLELKSIEFSHTLTFNLNWGNHTQFKEVLPQILKWLDQYGHRIFENMQLVFLHNLSIGSFLFGDFDIANRILQRILNHSSRDVRNDIRVFARLLQVILIHEMKKYDLNDYLIRNLRTFLRKQSAQIPFASEVVDYLVLAMRDPHAAPTMVQLSHVADLLHQLQSQTVGMPMTGLNEVLIWVESKRKGIPIQSEFMDRVQKVGK